MPARPNFFVVGAPKSGTSALYECVRQHPGIFVPNRKELHYFSREHAARSYYRPALIPNESRYRSFFAGAESYSAAGDFSPSYLYFEEAARGIKRFCEDARIIALLRQPTERTISHYLMDVAKGFQDRPLSEFIERTPQNAPYHFEYIETSFYAEALERYFEIFDRDNVLVLTAEELSRDTANVCRQVFNFLEVDDRIPVTTERRYNTYFMPRFQMVRRARSNIVAYRLYQYMPEAIRSGLKRMLQRQDVNKPELRYERECLDKLFEPEILRLSTLLGRDMAHLWSQSD